MIQTLVSSLLINFLLLSQQVIYTKMGISLGYTYKIANPMSKFAYQMETF